MLPNLRPDADLGWRERYGNSAWRVTPGCRTLRCWRELNALTGSSRLAGRNFITSARSRGKD